MPALWSLSAMCSLYPKQSREGQDVQLFLKTFVYHTILSFDYIIIVIIIIIKIIGGPVCISHVCYLAKFMNLLKKERKKKKSSFHHQICDHEGFQ